MLEGGDTRACPRVLQSALGILASATRPKRYVVLMVAKDSTNPSQQELRVFLERSYDPPQVTPSGRDFKQRISFTGKRVQEYEGEQRENSVCIFQIIKFCKTHSLWILGNLRGTSVSTSGPVCIKEFTQSKPVMPTQ